MASQAESVQAASSTRVSDTRWDESRVVRDTDPGEEGQFAPKNGGSGTKKAPQQIGQIQRGKAAQGVAKPTAASITAAVKALKNAGQRDALIASLRKKGLKVDQYEDGSGSVTVDGKRIDFPSNDDFGMSPQEQQEWARRTPGGWHDNDGAAGGSGGGGQGGGGSYSIKSGDTLSKIAQRELGSASRWPEIYQANKAVIDAEAKKHGKPGGGHWIFPGIQLKIPKRGRTASAMSIEDQKAALRASVHGTDDEGRKAALRASVHGVTAAIPRSVGKWIEALHPRGRDGKFIDKLGWVSGRFNFDGDSPLRRKSRHDRVQVVGFAENKSDPNDPYVVVEQPSGSRGYGLASEVQQVASPRARLDEAFDTIYGDEFRKSVQMVEEDNAALRKVGGLPNERDPKVYGLFDSLYPDQQPGEVGLRKFYATYAEDMAAGRDDFGANAASRLEDHDLDEAIEDLTRRIDRGSVGMSGVADLRTLETERQRRSGGGGDSEVRNEFGFTEDEWRAEPRNRFGLTESEWREMSPEERAALSLDADIEDLPDEVEAPDGVFTKFEIDDMVRSFLDNAESIEDVGASDIIEFLVARGVDPDEARRAAMRVGLTSEP